MKTVFLTLQHTLETDPLFARVVMGWHQLPESVRQTIAVLVERVSAERLQGEPRRDLDDVDKRP